MYSRIKIGGKKIEVNLTWKEVKYKFFKKKKCPTCGVKLKKIINDHSLGDKPFEDSDIDGKALNLHTERIIRTYAYHCETCDIEYPIQYLATK
jgi:hypothetical protein